MAKFDDVSCNWPNVLHQIAAVLKHLSTKKSSNIHTLQFDFSAETKLKCIEVVVNYSIGNSCQLGFCAISLTSCALVFILWPAVLLCLYFDQLCSCVYTLISCAPVSLHLPAVLLCHYLDQLCSCVYTLTSCVLLYHYHYQLCSNANTLICCAPVPLP